MSKRERGRERAFKGREDCPVCVDRLKLDMKKKGGKFNFYGNKTEVWRRMSRILVVEIFSSPLFKTNKKRLQFEMVSRWLDCIRF